MRKSGGQLSPSSIAARKAAYRSGGELGVETGAEFRVHGAGDGSQIEEPARFHDLLAVEPDVEIAADAVDVRLGEPRLAGVLGVGMAEGDVDAGNFFVLQDVPDDVRAGRVRADGELAHAVAVFVRARVGAEFVEQFLVVAAQARGCGCSPPRWSAACAWMSPYFWQR